MYEVHSYVAQPADEDRLWRYMTLANFVALLVEKYIFFSKLENLEDPFEGAPPQWVVDLTRRVQAIRLQNPDARGEEHVLRWRAAMAKVRRRVCVNCWHVNDHESEAMWKLYGQLGENVCITSDLLSLRECFANSPKKVTGALVDYDTPEMQRDEGTSESDQTMLLWASRKRPSYRHEREFRLLHLQDDDPENKSSGTHFAVEPERLIKTVMLSPTMPRWQVLTVHHLVDRLGYSLQIRESQLLAPPF